VLGVTAVGDTLQEAVACAYETAAKVDFPGGFCRSDIGASALRALEGGGRA
jgi:phosphoribosylamine--glycine ligase